MRQTGQSGMYMASLAGEGAAYDQYVEEATWIGGLFDESLLLCIDEADGEVEEWAIDRDTGLIDTTTVIAYPTEPKMLGWYYSGADDVAAADPAAAGASDLGGNSTDVPPPDVPPVNEGPGVPPDGVPPPDSTDGTSPNDADAD